MNEDDLELNEETSKEIKRARKDIKNGKYLNLEEVKKRLKL